MGINPPKVKFASLQQDAIACTGEFVGTTIFLFLGLGGAKAALASIPNGLQGAQTGLDSETIMNISVSMGLSLLVTAWIFYRISGGLFNPAVTLGLYLVGAIRPFRAVILFIAQIAGGIAGSGLLALLSPTGGIRQVMTTLQPGVNKGQGLMIEAFLTAILVFCILMLAAEKHRATYIAPIGIGLTLFACQLMGTLETGCGMNPARAFGPSVIATDFVSYHWIYWVGPFIGSVMAASFYTLLKIFDYTSVVTSQDSDDAANSPTSRNWQTALHGFSRAQREALLASGMPENILDEAERGMVTHAEVAVLMSRGPTMQSVGRPGLSRNATTVPLPTPIAIKLASAPMKSTGSLLAEKKDDGMISSAAMANLGTAPVIRIEGLDIDADAVLLPKSESGNIQVGMSADHQDVGAIGEPGQAGHGLAAVEKVADILKS